MNEPVVNFDAAKIGEHAQTWKRADGDQIWGEYSFMTGPEGLDDPYNDPIEYVVQTWQLVAEHTVTLPEPIEPDPDDADFEVIEDAYVAAPPVDDPEGPWAPRLVATAGQRVWVFKGATYGVVADAGIACSATGPLEGPFFEVARENLRAL